jgi:hypothetical protein
MSDDHPPHLSRHFAKACKFLSHKHIPIRPYTPRAKYKAKRLFWTLCREWAYGIPFQISDEFNQWLPCSISVHNRLKKQTALGGKSPQQRLNELLC